MSGERFNKKLFRARLRAAENEKQIGEAGVQKNRVMNEQAKKIKPELSFRGKNMLRMKTVSSEAEDEFDD